MPETGIPLVDQFLALLAAWGYLVVFVFTVFENLFVVGSFTPGETVVVAAAFVASLGSLDIRLVWLASVIGTVTGSNVSYWLGRRAGIESVHAFVERLAATRIGRLFRIDASALDDIEEHFATDGSKTVFFSRFAVGAKNFVPAMAGAVRMSVFWYEVHTVLGALTYTTLMCLIGWFLGSNMDRALQVAASIGWVGLALLLVMLSALVLARRRIKARRAAREHAAHDGDEASIGGSRSVERGAQQGSPTDPEER